MAAPYAGFTGMPNYGEVPLTVQFTDLSTGLPTSWLWTFGDGVTGSNQNPTHTYTEVGDYSVTLDVSNADGTGSYTLADVIETYRPASVVEAPAVVLVAPSTKYCSSLTCVGWVRDPVVGPSGNSLIPLAVSDRSGVVRGGAAALYFEIVADAGDWRLAFKGAKSRKIALSTGINLSDGLWHMLAWVSNDEGIMSFYVDGVMCDPEPGVGEDGVLYSHPHTTAVRVGGGYVWVPCLDEAGQSLTLFNWRYAGGLVIHGDWVRELMAVDRVILGL